MGADAICVSPKIRGRCLLSWSGGKDSAFALHILAGDVDMLLTTYLECSGDLPHVDVPVTLVRAQAESLGLPLLEVPIPDPWSADLYAERMTEVLRTSGAETVAFGDLHLEELRREREDNLAGIGVAGAFPCWTTDSASRAREIVDAGIEAVVVSVDTRRLDPEFLGRRFDRAFLADMPAGLDPCGERGEFQTFVVHHPGASSALTYSLGPVRHSGDFATLALKPF
jgi:uncharacterized protein (TIGR00290 family)